jgi:hypothetical protein
MDDEALRQFFLPPACPVQRQYEALRAVFVEGRSQKEAAQRFGYSCGAFRQLLLAVRSARTAPPLSLGHAANEIPNKQPLRPR